MINLTKGNTQFIYFTGTEKVTLSNPYFLFIFTNRATKAEVKVMFANVSTTGRYDKGSIIVNNYFSSSDLGLWSYEIREKALSTDTTTAGTIVETGLMYLRPATAFAPTEYEVTSNEFKQYGGQ